MFLFRVSHSVSWKFMKPHIDTVIREILFPLLCHSDEDEELWETDPIEYIRIKYGEFQYLVFVELLKNENHLYNCIWYDTTGVFIYVVAHNTWYRAI